jgi:hypothetical protein
MAGSIMIFHSESLENAWERIKGDVYYTAGVWDSGRVAVEEFIQPPEGYLYPAEWGWRLLELQQSGRTWWKVKMVR